MSDQPPQWGSGNSGDQGNYGGAQGGGDAFGGGGSGGYPPPPPNNYGDGGGYGGGGGAVPNSTGIIVASVISIFCCTPLGIAALVLAIMGNSKATSGDIAGAQQNLSLAKKLAIASIILGIIGTILYIGGIVLLGTAAENDLNQVGSDINNY